MRVTQRMLTRNYMKGMNDTMSKRAACLDRMTSGEKYQRFSENVSDGAKALRVREQLAKNEQSLTGVRDANGQLSSAESNLMSINDILQTVQEKVNLAMSDTAQGDKREALANEIANLRQQVLQFANSQFGDQYLFSGTQNGKPPFSIDETTGKTSYNGIPVEDIYVDQNDGKRYYNKTDGAGVVTPTLVPEDGDVFIDVGMGIRMDGDNVDPRTAFKLSFSGLDVLGFGTSNVDGATLPNNIIDLLGDIEKSISPDYDKDRVSKLSTQLKGRYSTMLKSSTEIGTRCKFLDKTQERLENDHLNLKELQSNLETVDPATESIQAKVYEAAWLAVIQLGAKIIPPSLMDYIN